MSLRSRRSEIAPSASWSRAVGIGLLATFLSNVAIWSYEILVLGDSYAVTPIWLTMQFVGCMGTIGLPVALWSRYELRAPLVSMALVFSLYLSMPVFTGGGDAPPVLLLVVLAPIFVGIYLLVAGLEHLLRSRKPKRSTPA